MTSITVPFDVVKLSPMIGAEIRGLDLTKDMSPAVVAALYRAWLDHIVLVFRGQELDQEALLRVTSWFGQSGELSRPTTSFPRPIKSCCRTSC